ncbi:efflux RND transporter periplasmic adaptor subunit [Lysobacter pythonis]|uniref:Efflux RND transporter periplasmic adaptor subunit n=1 Tax=Solilutibacter pythonis TaxID=2483112 RepID=A0A3M2I577_9GAMM|nr:efflux RND transporter periplasmic adaptor subunit [Lysobacter pythonis]RMH93414.1 efflux RND transporter periplasmic adaptor subunit [Lysobacter pythonis]
MNASADLLRELRIDRQATPPPNPRRKWWVAAAVIAALLALAAVSAFFVRPKPLPVDTATARSIGAGGEAASVLDASGYVVARRMATVSAKVPGKVQEVLIEEGQRVEAGQVIARLDPIDAAQQRQLAQAQVAAAESQRAGVAAQLREAEANATRLSTLAGRQLVSRAQLDTAIAQRDALRAQLTTIARQSRVAEAQSRIARQGVDNTVVRAPFAGIVTAKAAQPGEIVSPIAAGGGFTRTGIGTIVDMDSLEIEVEVGEAYIGRVQPGMPVEAGLNAYPDWNIPAEVIAIIPAADRGKATVKVRIGLKTKDPRIVPDMGVKVSFLEKPKTADTAKPEGVRVPAAAIAERGGKTVAFVVDANGVVTMTPVASAEKLGERDVRIVAGLKPGDVVVLAAPDTLKSGMAITANDATGEE